MICSVPGARIFTPEVVFEIDEGDKMVLVFELLSIKRADAPFDAETAADLLQTPSAQPVEFDDRQAYAVVRALDNLRDGNRLDGRSELLRIREALRGRLQLPTVSYELGLPGAGDLVGWISYSGPREAGDRLLTHDGSQWRVVSVEKREGQVDLLECEPWIDPDA